MGFGFELRKRDQRTAARVGVMHTPHGGISTPVFAPVGTQATVKTLTPDELVAAGAELILANTYHLYLRPGADLIAEFGGVHGFMAWDHPLLTDSGGFQVFSLEGLREIDDDGVRFRSHLDGSEHFFSPERSIQIQEMLGADIIMAFDECAEPSDRAYSEAALERTHRWAERCRVAQTREDQALFGIVQGGVFADLRESSARFLSALDFPGYAIGGLSVGESKDDMHAMLDVTASILPEDKPRYLMGVGSPEDLWEGVARGIDLFDCVLPTRLARNGALLTHAGRLNLRNAQFARDHGPIEDGCSCYTCQRFSRAYLRHLLKSGEVLGLRLNSLHNVHFMLNLMSEIRRAIKDDVFDAAKDAFLSGYRTIPYEVRRQNKEAWLARRRAR